MLPEIDLLPKKERQSTVYLYVFLSLILVCILAIGYVIFAYFQSTQQLEQATQMETTLTEKEANLQGKKTKLEQPDTDTLTAAIERTEAQAFPTSILMNHLLLLLPEDSYLREYKYKFGAVEVHSHFNTMRDISTYTERLLASPFVTNVKVDKVKAFRLKNEGETSRATREDIELYYEKIPRYDVEITFQMDRPAIRAVQLEEAEDMIEEIEADITEGASADE